MATMKSIGWFESLLAQRVFAREEKKEGTGIIVSETADGDVCLAISNGQEETELYLSEESAWELCDVLSELVLDMAARRGQQ
jgi:hypothetical protein